VCDKADCLCCDPSLTLWLRILQTASLAVRAMCVCQRALSLLCAGGAGCAGAALEAVGNLGPAEWETLGVGQLALRQFTQGLASLRQGSSGEAKALLSRCLKLAHEQLSSHELVTQVLAMLVHITMREGDMAQALQMMRSGYALCKSCSDVPGELASISAWCIIEKSIPTPPQTAAELESQAKRKSAKLQKTIASARQCAAHEAAMALLD